MTTISGAESNAHINLSGGGGFQGGDLKTEEMIVNCSGGKVQAWMLHPLDADLSGVSSLTSFGDPQTINQNTSGGSSIKSLGPK